MYKVPENVTVRPSQPADVEFVAANMRQADRDEIWASYFSTPHEALTRAMKISEKCWTLVCDGEPVAMFGVARRGMLSNVGSPWLLGTDKVKKYTPAFLRLSPIYVSKMMEGFVRLENYVDFRNKLSIRWLQWMGFELGELVPGLILGVKFYRFYMETPTKCANPQP